MEDGLIKKVAGSYFHPHNEPVVELRQGGAAGRSADETGNNLEADTLPRPAARTPRRPAGAQRHRHCHADFKHAQIAIDYT